MPEQANEVRSQELHAQIQYRLILTSLLPLALFPLFGVLSPAQVAQSLGSPLILLLLGGFMISEAMVEKARGMDDIEILEEAAPLPFNSEGNLF